jgi:hypothetical protein
MYVTLIPLPPFMSFAVLILCANEAVSSVSSMQVNAPASYQILKDCIMFPLLEYTKLFTPSNKKHIMLYESPIKYLARESSLMSAATRGVSTSFVHFCAFLFLFHLLSYE